MGRNTYGDYMDHSLVLTVMGPDRKGILAKISDIIDDHGGSWFESKVARFAGQFTGILKFDCPDERHDDLLAALELVDNIQVKVIRDYEEVPQRVTKRLAFNILGNHRPGIMKQVATAISKVGANIEELITERDSCPMAGHILFRAIGSVEVVEDFDETSIEDVLHSIGADLSVVITPIDSEKNEEKAAEA